MRCIRDKYEKMEAGNKDLSFLQFACLNLFLRPLPLPVFSHSFFSLIVSSIYNNNLIIALYVIHLWMMKHCPSFQLRVSRIVSALSLSPPSPCLPLPLLSFCPTATRVKESSHYTLLPNLYIREISLVSYSSLTLFYLYLSSTIVIVNYNYYKRLHEIINSDKMSEEKL